MDETRDKTYQQFLAIYSGLLANPQELWTEEVFEDSWSRFSEEIYREPWKLITDQEEKFLKDAIEVLKEVSIQMILAESELIDLSEEERFKYNQIRLIENSTEVDSTEFSTIKYLIWYKVITRTLH